MMLIHPMLQTPINFAENRVNLLIVEDAAVLRGMIRSLMAQCGGAPGDFVLSEDHQPIELSKKISIVTDIFQLDFSSRKIQTGIGRMAGTVGSAYGDEIAPLLASINLLGEKIAADLDFSADYTPVDSPDAVVRLLDFHAAADEMDLPEQLLEYMRLQRAFFGKEIFVFIDLKAFLSAPELELLYRNAAYEKLTLFLLESCRHAETLPGEEIRILDEDLCEI